MPSLFQSDTLKNPSFALTHWLRYLVLNADCLLAFCCATFSSAMIRSALIDMPKFGLALTSAASQSHLSPSSMVQMIAKQFSSSNPPVFSSRRSHDFQSSRHGPAVSAPAVEITRLSGWSRAPMPVSMVSMRSLVLCSWYSSMIAQCGDDPSPGLPITGMNFELSCSMMSDCALMVMPSPGAS